MGKLTQWLKGRIYERRCDISDDGKYLIYFAFQVQNTFKKDKYTAYTTISKYPYLKALDLWKNMGTYNGGGLFLSKKEYLLNEIYDHEEIHKLLHSLSKEENPIAPCETMNV